MILPPTGIRFSLAGDRGRGVLAAAIIYQGWLHDSHR
jgi:hypothetical protein